MMDLPRGWTLCEIGDVLRPVEMTRKNEENREIFYIDISSIDNQSNRIMNPKRTNLSDAPSRARQKVHAGDVLFSTVRPYLRNIATVDHELDGEIASTGFAVIRGAEGIEPQFLFYKCISHDFVSALTGQQYGVSYPAVKEEQVKARPLELPPTLEQRRIVETIEALFEEIDRGVESLRAAKNTVALYRQSLLKSAFEGHLTAEWRAQHSDKLEAPDALLARIHAERQARYGAALDEWEKATAEWRAHGEQGKKPAKPQRPKSGSVVTNGQLAVPTSWTTAPLRVIAFDAVLGKMLDRQKNRGYPRIYLGNINIRWGSFDVDPSKRIPIEDHEIPRYSVRIGDLIICEGGEPGRCAIWDGDNDCVFIQKALHRVRFTSSYLPRFAYFFFKFATVAGLLNEHYTGSTIKHLTGTALQEILLPICCPSEQAEVIRILDARFEAVEMLDREIDANLARADALRQSVLKKAFAGELVPQDPDDEPASVLLERIRTDRAKAPARQRRTQGSNMNNFRGNDLTVNEARA